MIYDISARPPCSAIDLLQMLLGRDRVLFAPTYHGANTLDLHALRRTGAGETVVWAPGDEEARTSALGLVQFLRESDIDARYETAGLREMWLKFGVTASTNAVCALLRRRLGSLEQSANAWHVVGALAGEVAALARHEGIDITGDDIRARIEIPVRTLPQALPSVLQDLLRHRVTEVEWLNGCVVQKGSDYGIEVRYHACVYDLVRAAEETNADDLEGRQR